jgi:hypothetical protein
MINMIFRNELTRLHPDVRCYNGALATMAKCHEPDDVGTLVDKTLQEMRENNMCPDTECYRAAIIAWKNSASKRDSNNTEECIYRAQQLFQEMSQKFRRTTVVTVQPSTEDYNKPLLMPKSSFFP